MVVRQEQYILQRKKGVNTYYDRNIWKTTMSIL
jgi:hypothetical protein